MHFVCDSLRLQLHRTIGHYGREFSHIRLLLIILQDHMIHHQQHGILLLVLYRISASANPESSHFLEIQLSPAPAKFLAGFGGCQYSCSVSLIG